MLDQPLVQHVDLRVTRVIQHITHNLAEHSTLGSASELAGLSPSHFSRCFKRALGINFHEWNARIRIQEAQRLLRTTSLTVSAVALAVGYQDIATFERNFKKFVGITPRRFRQHRISTPKDNTDNVELSCCEHGSDAVFFSVNKSATLDDA